MKKLINFIKPKERDNEYPLIEKKADPKTKKAASSPVSPEVQPTEQKDLFWDGYSDIGYC